MAAETRQQELLVVTPRILTDDTCPLIVEQWGTQCWAGTVIEQHEASADNGIARAIITSADATSLDRNTMLLP